ncbi:MAG TPA: Ig-like domain repeat protein [Actinomycetota bacterium]|nr:Ig-like domain repeat protein [Actinomycetota bacterium]
MITLTPGRSAAATTVFAVTKTTDSNDGACTPILCSLRDAVAAANTTASTSANPVQINLGPGTYTLTLGELDLGKVGTTLDVVINGTGVNASSVTIQQNTANSTVFLLGFDVAANSFVTNQSTTFQNLTITGGVDTRSTTGNGDGLGGGAIQAGGPGQSLTITNCVFTGNQSLANGSGGGAIFDGAGSLTISGSTFSNNTSASGFGGAVGYSDTGLAAGDVSITNSTFTNNTVTAPSGASDGGGGVFIGGSSINQHATVSGSTFSGNSAGGPGGGLFIDAELATSVTTSQFINNTAGTVDQGKGGGVYISSSNPTPSAGSGSITLSTFTGNSASGHSGGGGAIWNDIGPTTVAHNRIVGNTATFGSGIAEGVDTGSVNANDNWWGVNTGPGAGVLAAASVSPPATAPTAPSWLQLRTIASPAVVAPGGSTTFTADLLGRNTGGPLAAGTLNGLASFPSPPGVFSNAVDGTLSATAGQFVNGVATSAFTAGTTLGTNAGHVDAVADSQTITGGVSVKADSSVAVTTSGTPTVFGQPVTFTATLSSQVAGTTPAVPQGGTVTFFIDGIPGSPVTVSNGSAHAVLSNLTVGVHTVQAVYSGDSDFNGSSALLPGNQTVNKANSATAVASSLTPSFAGESVTFTATVTASPPGAGTPGGTVQFEDGGSPVGSPATLNGSGVATVSTSGLSVGSHTITAVYGGNLNFNGSTGTLSPDQVVNPAPTAVTVFPSFDPSVFGQPVTFAAQVNAALAGTPGGFVQFGINGENLGATETLVAGQAVTPVITNLPVGSVTVTATYTATDGVHAGSSGLFNQTVLPASTATTVGAAANPAVAGTAIDFSATVTAVAPSTATPTGTVQFAIDGSNVGSPQALSGGVATLSGVTSLSIGTHPVVATYLGDTDFVTSTSSTLSEVVNGFATTTTVTSSASPSVFGQPVSFTATVDAGANGTPTGTVQFGIDGANLGAPVTLAGGSASSPSVASLAVGTHTVTATYSGGSSFGGSSGTLAGGQLVNQAGSTTGITSDPNPSVFGQPVVVTATVAAAAPGVGTPTGSIQFQVDNVNVGGPVGLSGGIATTTVTGLPVGLTDIRALYGASSNFTSSGADVGQTVNRAGSAVTAGSSVNPSLVGQGVTFNATVTAVAPGAGTPTGTVSFFVDGSHYEDVSLASGVASTTTPDTALTLGDHTVTATYGGNADFTASSGGLTQTVTKAATTTTVTSAVNPSVFGQPVTFTATVAPVPPATGTPTGTVEFFADGTSFGSSPLSGSTAVSPAIASLAVGGHTVTATYSGDANFGTSTGTTPQTVSQAATALSFAGSPNPSAFGQPVSFSATVTAVAPGAGTPTGTVHFAGNGFPFPGVDAPLVNGVATTTTTAVPTGITLLSANYAGNGDYAPSGATTPHTVNPAATTTTVTSAVNPSAFGSAVTFSATVAPVAPGAGVPTGQVQFFVDGAASGGPAGLSGGTAVSAPVSGLATGNHSVTATYAGGSDFLPSTSAALTQGVGRVAPAIGVTSTVNPSVFGQPVSFTATVTGTQGTATGTVQFGVDGANLGAPVTLTAGVATSTDIASLSVGAHTVTATYAGDGTYLPGTGSVTQTVTQASSSTTVTSSKSPSVFGESVQFTATVAAVAPGAGTPGGQVQFLIDGSDSGGPVSLSGGSASITRSGLSVGNHSVTAQYLGDASFTTSSGSLPGGQAVNASPSATSVTSSKNPSVLGNSIHFTAVVAASGNGSGTPGGQVQFLIDGSNLGSPVSLSGGSAVSGAISSLTVGTHTVDAQYLGDGNFNPSSGSLPGGQVVTPGGTSTMLSSSENPSTVGDAVVFTATVAPTTAAGTPGGTVQFRIDGSDVGSPVTLSGGTASYSTSSLAVGNHTVSAVYSGDATYAGSTGTLAGGQTVVAVIDVDLSVQKVGPRQAVVGEYTPYVIVVTNNGPHAATGVTVSDTLPAGFSLPNTWSSQGSCSGAVPTVTCSLGSLAPGAHAYVILVTVAHDAGTATNNVTVSGDQTDPHHGNNSARATTRVHQPGYWLFGADGGVFSFGDGQFYGSTGGMTLNKPVVAMAATPDGLGYWLFASDGGVFAFGDAEFHGSVASVHLNAPIVAMAPTPDGGGYWLFGADGGVFALGDAPFFGSTGGQHLPAPIVGMAITPTGGGYWLVGADGAIYPFGDAQSYGSPSSPGAPIVGMAATRDGGGYWEVDKQGRVYSLGDAAAYGSLPGTALGAQIVGMAATADTQGYWLVGRDGGVFAFGDAPYLGGMSGTPLNKPITGITPEG